MALHHTEDKIQWSPCGPQGPAWSDHTAPTFPPVPVPQPTGAALLFLEYPRHTPSHGLCVGFSLSPAPLLPQHPRTPSVIHRGLINVTSSRGFPECLIPNCHPPLSVPSPPQSSSALALFSHPWHHHPHPHPGCELHDSRSVPVSLTTVSSAPRCLAPGWCHYVCSVNERMSAGYCRRR